MEKNGIEFLSALQNKQRGLPLPAQLAVTVDGRPDRITALSILRLLPGKRVVFHGIFDNKSVAVKFFIKSSSSSRHIQRERAGYERVRIAGVSCPKLIGYCSSECGNFEGLIYEFIADAAELAQSWAHFDNQQKRHWLQRVVTATLQLHHRAGAYQSDIHLGNFLIKNDQLCLLDLGSIVVRSAPLPQEQCLANLGQLVAQFDVDEQALLDEPIDRYLAQCGWSGVKSKLHGALQKAWRHRLRDYLGKAKRDCSLTSFEQNFRRVFAFRRAWQSDDLQSFARDPDRFMQTGELLKAGNTATVVKTVFNGKPVVIKRYNIKNWRHAINRSLRPSRAEHSWRMAHMLELIGIDSLEPIALLEHRYGPLRSTAYFVSGYIDAPDLLTIGKQRALSDKEADSLQSTLLTMCTCRLSHGDFKANNLLVDREQIAVIDLDAMQRHRAQPTFSKALRKDVHRLLANWTPDQPARPQTERIVAVLLESQNSKANFL
ncbi:MAG TPA: lipopolysaccharide kinase InaA family protein [Spongiibacteraceae bacterium]|nr:lipopolysaccharide kinase InaA family protein [Spongiibacteraceae bacterium]